MSTMDGQTYAPTGKPAPVCEKGEFLVGVIGLDHGHIYGMCNGLIEAGATVVRVWDPDPEKVEAFVTTFPSAVASQTKEAVLQDPSIHLIASAAIPSDRGSIGLAALDAGKDFFTDKPPFTTLEQTKAARAKVKETGGKWFVYYSERIHVEAAVWAEKLLAEGAIGDLVSLRGWGPHRLAEERRPAWFFEKDRYGGIIIDIGSHQVEQMLFFSGATDATIVSSRVGNLNNPHHPELEDYGDVCLTTDTGIPCYFTIDWFTPDGLGTWGDGRFFLIGTKGYMELRKYIDVAASSDKDTVILVNDEGEQRFNVSDKVGFPFFGRVIRDSLDRTETAMSQEHAFRAIEIAIEAQEQAQRVR
ncbi:MAG TPA: Gfo/Idh/MocA family oxidoreductase [Sphaerochaeta sp.]|nr:Gfo/Idh/MocA family oxidoreductase [Sphaerochaeta sp.]